MTDFEQSVKEDLHKYLMLCREVDQRLPDAPDIEDKWEAIARSYMPDGVREFQGYPNVSLGWMMYIGMAVAKMWDEDWEAYSRVEDLYLMLRDKHGYDIMDEYIREEVLELGAEAYAATEKLVGECASRTNSRLYHSGLQDGTKEAFEGYVSCLHQLYLMGAAVQLKRMGYSMQKL